MSSQSANDSQQLHDRACRFLFGIVVAVCVVLCALGGPLLVLVYGAEFGEATTLFQLLVVEAGFAVMSQVTMHLFLARDRPGVVSAIQVGVLAVSIVTMLILVPLYGAIGAAFTLVCAAVLRWVLLLAFLRIALKVPLPRLIPRRDDLTYVWVRLRSTGAELHRRREGISNG
jgi:O-antigen/teichoic acid export membrane protein